MKKILIAAAILFATVFTVNAQNNFTNDDGKIIWQKVFESNADIVDALNGAGIFTDITVTEKAIYAKMNQTAIDLNGRSPMNVPIFIRDSNMTCSLTIQAKEGRYRVTVENLAFFNKYENQSSGTPLEFWYIKQDKTLKPSFEKVPAPILNEALTELFDFKVKLTDEW